MGKIKAVIRCENEEFRSALEYLLMSSGYFELLSEKEYGGKRRKTDDGGSVRVIDIKVDEMIGESFATFLGRLLEKEEEIDSGNLFSKDGLPEMVALAALDSFPTCEFAVELGKKLFAEGFKSAYLSLKPLNQKLSVCANNENGFCRWLMDARRGRVGPPEKYIFDSGEMIFVGASLFNPNAGDVEVEDIVKMLEQCAVLGIDYLVIDIGMHLDLERKKVFLMSDYPIIFTEGTAVEESIIHKHFEGAITMGMDDDNEGQVQDVVDSLLRGRGEQNEGRSIWN